MAGRFLDTNLIVRYLTQDHLDQAQRAHRLFTELETGATQAVISEAVIVEAVYVLSSRATYNMPRPWIKGALAEVIRLPGVKLANKRSYLRALDLYASANIDFVDALSVAHMERLKLDVILSFDRDFDRIKTIKRQEP